jgi:hypothetical protein
LMFRLHTTSVLDVLHMHGKAKGIAFPMELVSCPTKIGVIRNHKNNTNFRTIFGAAPLFWPDGPCIQLESIRDAS